MRVSLLGISLFLILISGWMALTVGAVEPIERNIIYIHVPASICALACFCVLFVCSILYLKTKNNRWDYIAAASGEVGFVFATVLNITGMVFARIEWNAWWTPSPRLISSAVLWFLYAAYIMLRSALPAPRTKKIIGAVFGIIAFIDVPLVVLSARFIPDIHRPAFSFDTLNQILALALAVCGTILLMIALLRIKSDVLKIKDRMDTEL